MRSIVVHVNINVTVKEYKSSLKTKDTKLYVEENGIQKTIGFESIYFYLYEKMSKIWY